MAQPSTTYNVENSLKILPNFDMRATNAGEEWPLWKMCFEDYLVASGRQKENDSVKVALLRNMLGPESSRILLTLPDCTGENVTYKDVIAAIEGYVCPRLNHVFQRFKFNERKQFPDEKFENFFTDCKRLISTCNYNIKDKTVEPIEDQLLRDKIVHGISDKSVQESLLRQENLTLKKAADFCRAAEQSKEQVKIMNPTSSVEIDRVKFNRNKTNKKNDQAETKFNCSRCQTLHGPRKCPAYGKKCSKCGILNHLAISCRVRRVQNVNVQENQNNNSSDESDSSLFCGMVNSTKGNEEWCENIIIENKKVNCRLDTGADVSVMPLKIFQSLESDLQIMPVQTELESFQGSKIKPLGMVNLMCKYKDMECEEDFMIVNNNSMLLGAPGCVKLNLLKRVYNLTTCQEKSKFIAENIEVFTGHGKFPTKINIPTMNHDPICNPPIKVPLALQEPLKCELARLVKRGAIQKVDEISSEACINRIVIIEKPNKKLRLCLDPTDLNKYVIRKPKNMLTIDEVASKLRDMEVYSVFDLTEGFHHCPLTDEASWKCCFATPYGVYRYLVLPYGITNAPEVFQDQIESYFGQIPNVLCWFDDILVMGKNVKEHDDTVKKLLEKAKEVGAVFNKEKLQYKQKEVKYIGQIFSKNGMRVDEERIESLLQLKSPCSKEELQRIIGSFNYVRRYVPEMSELMSPLCKLLKKDVEFQWLPLHEEMFNKLKHTIAKAPALTPFNPDKEIILQCDASKNGVGCCMFQKDGNDIMRLVACVSRTMNSAEVNYSQCEKELLAIYYGTQKFHKYIYGSDSAVVHTDHKPLIPIMSKQISKIGSPRLRRLRLKLLKYKLNLHYVPGKLIHFADLLSRNSRKQTDRDIEMLDMVHSVSLHLPMSQEKKKEFRLATNKDKILIEISNYYYNGWPEENKMSKDCLPYYKLRHDIYVESGFVFIGSKIIVPESLKYYVLKLIHQGHPGINKSITKARQLFYWPSMSEDIKKFIKKCRTCEKFQPKNYFEPMLCHDVPKQRFSKVGSDILDYAGKSFLVIVDYLSHWLEIIPLYNKTSKSIIEAMQQVFTRFGYPQIIVADNNPFLSYECKEYYKSKEINIVTSSPHYHRSNGLAEKAVHIAKTLLKKATEDNVDYRDSLLHYNNTPLSGLQFSPSQILQSRRLRTNLPTTSEALEPKIERNVHALLNLRKAVTKKFHDRKARRKEQMFEIGEQIVYKTDKEKIWKKGMIVGKAEEPRSYLVKGDNNNALRRNNYHIRKSYTKVNYYPRDKFVVASPSITHPEVSNSESRRYETLLNNSQSANEGCYITRSGRAVKPRNVLDL